MFTFAALLILNATMSLSTSAMDMDGKEAMAILPPAAQAEHEKAMRDLQEKGYVDSPDTISYCAYALKEMQKRYWNARNKGLPTDLRTLGFTRLDQYDFSQHTGVKINRIPHRVTRRDSKNYVIPDGNSVRRIYVNSAFGTLLVKESLGTMRLVDPNLTIADHPAKWVTEKHRGNTWSTTVHAEDGEKIYQIEAGRRLMGRNLDRFLDFVRDFIETGSRICRHEKVRRLVFQPK